MSTKELEKVFKSLALQINDEQLKEWADEMDEEGMTLVKVFITLTRVRFHTYGFHQTFVLWSAPSLHFST